MSHLLVCELNMTDERTVEAALRKLGFTAIEISSVNDLIARNYDSTKNTACTVVMRAESFGGLADFCMKRAKSGNLAIYADDMDMANTGRLTRKAQSSENGSKAYGFADNLSLWYGALKAEESLLQEGMMPTMEWVSDAREELRVFAEYA